MPPVLTRRSVLWDWQRHGPKKIPENHFIARFEERKYLRPPGPRIRIRLFAGYDFDEDMLTAADGIERAYAKGITMGGTLSPASSTDDERVVKSAPEFIVMASADPESAPLQRLQIVKGWVDVDGTHEKVIDVACAGGVKVNIRNKSLP